MLHFHNGGARLSYGIYLILNTLLYKGDYHFVLIDGDAATRLRDQVVARHPPLTENQRFYSYL